MAPVPILHGEVTADGRLVLDGAERQLRAQHLRHLAGKRVEIIVRKERTQRSLDQNAYLHAIPFSMLAEEWGEDIETTKLLVLGECFGWRDLANGARIPMKPSSAALTVDECSHLIEWIVKWAAVPGNVCARGFMIPLPKEASF
jgi:hypothetical protein